MLQGCLVLVFVSVLGKKCLHGSFQINMILFKNSHCPSILHYPLSNHDVGTRTMKKSRICLLLLDIYNLVWFHCSGRQVIGLYVAPTRAVILVKKLQSWRVVVPFQGWRKEPLKNRRPAIFESELVSLCGESQIVTFPCDLGFLLTAGVLVQRGEAY